MSEPTESEQQPTNQPTTIEQAAAELAKAREEIAYWKNEGKKAFADRDRAKREAAEAKPAGIEEFLSQINKRFDAIEQKQSHTHAQSKFDRDLAAAGVTVDAASREEVFKMYSAVNPDNGSEWLKKWLKPSTPTAPAEKQEPPPVAPPSTPSASVDRATNLPSNPKMVDRNLWFAMKPEQRRAHVEKFLQEAGYGGSNAFRKG